MVTRLLFEGASLAELLARVRAEHGPDVHIVAANRVRSGGFAGFFSRETYAITVEVDETRAAAPPQAEDRAVDAPGSLLDLADAINSAEEAEERVAMATAPMGATASGGALPVPPRPTLRRPVLSTDSPAFADILARWADAAEPDAVAPPPLPAGQAGQALEPPVEASDGADDLPARLGALGVPEDVLGRVRASRTAGVWERIADALAAALPAQPEIDLRPGDVLVVAGPAAAALDLGRVLAARLRLDPAAVLLACPGEQATGIEDALRISGPGAARRRAGALRRADVPTIVAVDAPCDGTSAEWARDVADALGALVTWALVDAVTKPADVADHVGALGRVDGIAVRGTAATRDPAAVLGAVLDLGVPTVWLDEGPGDARAWAGLLAARLDGTRSSARLAAGIPAQRGRHRRSAPATT